MLFPQLQSSFSVINVAPCPIFDGQTIVLQHRTGAQFFILDCPDAQKVFSITFRTFPEDNCGSAHILEHSVLCGSRKYSLGDPFIEFEKVSWATFMNAFTYPHFTQYPVASCHQKDFLNLIDFYCDSVFYPKLLENPNIFYQEGYHFSFDETLGQEVEQPTGINGVVYNEMLGSLSGESVLSRYIMHETFPKTPFSYDSGGDPLEIPHLRFERLVQFYKDHYTPDNALFYIYGQTDYQEILSFIDEEYLQKYDDQAPRKVAVSQIVPLKRDSVRKKTLYYKQSHLEQKFLSLTFCLNRRLTLEEESLFNILIYVLFDSSNAPVKEALLDKGYGSDVEGFVENELSQTTFTVIIHESKKSYDSSLDQDVCHAIYESIQKDIFWEQCHASIARELYTLVEKQFSGSPDGLIPAIEVSKQFSLGQDALSWSLPTEILEQWFQKDFPEVQSRELLDSFFRSEIARVWVELLPDPNLKIKLPAEEYLKDLPQKVRKKLIQSHRLYQDYDPLQHHDTSCLPQLHIQDIRLPKASSERIYCEDNISYLWFPNTSSRVTTLQVYHDLSAWNKDLYSLLPLYLFMLGRVGCTTMDEDQVSLELDKNFASFSAYLNFYYDYQSGQNIPQLCFHLKLHSFQIEPSLHFVEYLLCESRFNNMKLFKLLLNEYHNLQNQTLENSPNLYGMYRATSYIHESYHIRDYCYGLPQIDIIHQLRNCSEDDLKLVQETMNQIGRKIFASPVTMTLCDRDSNLNSIQDKVHFYGKKSQQSTFEEPRIFDAKVSFSIPKMRQQSGLEIIEQSVQSSHCFIIYEGMNTPYPVGKVIVNYLSHNLLWNEIRINGGAYGVHSDYHRTPYLQLSSYRDPNPMRSRDIFRDISKLVKTPLQKKDWDSSVLGYCGKLNRPMSPSASASFYSYLYFSNLSYDTWLEELEQCLHVTRDDVYAFAEELPDKPVSEVIIQPLQT